MRAGRDDRPPVTLMYHDVTPAGRTYGGIGESVTRYFVTAERFGSHLAAVDDADVRVTFDDGWLGSFETAGPILQSHHRTAVVFVTAGLVGQPHFATAETLRAAVESGVFRVGGHGVTHRMLATLPEAEIRRELTESKRQLEDWTGRVVDTFAAPGGSIDARVERIARECGYAELFGSRPGRDRVAERVGRRMAVTKGTTADDVAAWASGRFGTGPLRFAALDAAKRTLGRGRYERLRTRLLGSADDLDMTDLLTDDVRRDYGLGEG